MVVKRTTLRWRVVRSLFFGIAATLLVSEFCAFYATPFTLRSWHSSGTNLKNVDAPNYLQDIAPPYEHGRLLKPHDLDRKQPFYAINLGMDAILFVYREDSNHPNDGMGTYPHEFPSLIYIERYRFGWPWRALYRDNPRTSDHITIQNISSYRKMMHDRAGYRRGYKAPFTSKPVRLPIAPLWPGLFANIVFWSSCWIVQGTIWRTVRTYRRKRRGLCLACGYAVEDLERCPECGTDRDQERG